MEIPVFVIRHRVTGELMPLLDRNRGYSHWNPTHPEHEHKSSLGVPRIFKAKADAVRAIGMWNACPNATMSYSRGYFGEEDYGLDIHPDDRNRDDLEVLAARLVVDNG